MKLTNIFFILISILLHVNELFCVDLYLSHLDRKTKTLFVKNNWNLKESGVFNPRFPHVDPQDSDSAIVYDYSEVSPMLKITGSDVELDGHKHSITNMDDNHGGQIGIEIGYSPAELQIDSTLQQPHSIRIKNLRLIDFDAGIIIHHGVYNVTIENCVISGSSIGILMLGNTGPVLSNRILDIYIKNVQVVGHASDRQESLVALKAFVENRFDYPADMFMKLQEDILNNNAVDVHMYAGIWAINTENIEMKHVKVNHFGYCDFATNSEGNGRRTKAFGLIFKKCKRVTLQDISSNNSFSELQSGGMLLCDVMRVRLKHGIFANHASGLQSVGVQVVNDSNLDYSVDEVVFDNVSCEENVAGELAIGIDLTDSRGFEGVDLVCKFNKGGKQSYGIYTTKANTLTLATSTLSSMLATHQVNDVATEKGVVAAGFYGENVVGFQIKKCSCVSMQALNSAYGVYLKDSSDIRIENSQFSANISSSRRSGEEAAIRAEQDVTEISRYAPVVDATSTGSYGLFAKSCDRMKIENCFAVSNYGNRAAGFYFNSCRSVGVIDTLASAQVATGLMLDSSFLIDHVANPAYCAIQPAHMSLLFSDMTKSSVDLVKTTDLFLDKMTAIRSRQAASLEPLYDDVVTAIATKNLLEAAVARYRLWGTSFGIHAHNTIGCLFENNICLGQLSLFDGAAGICFSGRNSGHLIQDCKTSYNISGHVSSQALADSASAQYGFKYNLSAMKLFWETLTNPWTLHRSLSGTSDILTVAFSPDGSMLAVGDSDSQIKIWNVATASLSHTLTDCTGPVTSLSWSSDGTKLASSSSSSVSNIKIFNTTTWNCIKTITHGSSGVNVVAFKPDDSQLASGSAGTTGNIKIFDTTTWINVRTLTHSNGSVNDLAWTPSGAKLASASSASSNNIKIFNTSLLWLVDQTLSDHGSAVNTVAFSPDGQFLASGSDDTTVKVYNTSTWSLNQTLSDHTVAVRSVSFKENSKKLAAAGTDGKIMIWDVTTWGAAEQILSGHSQDVRSLSWRSDGIMLASGSADDTAKVWYADSWKVAKTTDDIGIYNQGFNFIAQGQKMFGDGSLGDDITIRLKETNDRVMVSPIGPIGAGMILGDFMIDAYVKNNKVQFNVGNAGFGYGVLLNQSYYSVLEQNLIEGSLSSIYGFGSGILDVTAHSVNTYLKNMLESNKVSVFSNANYIIPFNPSDSHALGFPVTKMHNGNFVQPSTDLDNIVIEYSQNSEAYGVESLVNLPLHPDLKAELTAHGCWQ